MIVNTKSPPQLHPLFYFLFSFYFILFLAFSESFVYIFNCATSYILSFFALMILLPSPQRETSNEQFHYCLTPVINLDGHLLSYLVLTIQPPGIRLLLLLSPFIIYLILTLTQCCSTKLFSQHSPELYFIFHFSLHCYSISLFLSANSI